MCDLTQTKAYELVKGILPSERDKIDKELIKTKLLDEDWKGIFLFYKSKRLYYF